jgi:hypothetical protein
VTIGNSSITNNYFTGNIRGGAFIRTGGTSGQFLKADGSVDSNVYALNSALANYQLTSEKGQPNGYASLDSNGKVPLVQINDALIGNVNFQGLWNAATNTPTLANPPASGTKGYYYIVSTAGTFAGISFEVGDWIISNGTAWGKVDNTDAVSSVFGRTGNVTASNGDYNTSQVTENTNLYYTEARVNANANVAANTAARHNAVTLGTANGLSLSTQELSLGVASAGVTGALSGTDWSTFNSKQNALNGTGFVKISGTTISYDNTSYLPLTGGTLTGPLGGTSISLSGDITANRYRGVNSLVLNTYTTVNPSSNVYLYSPPNDRDAWIYLDSADTGSNWGIYHRQIDSDVSGLPQNSIGFIGGGTNTLQAWISLLNGNGFFAGSLTASNLSGTNTGNVTIGTANGLSLSGQALSLGLASGSANGALSSTDWNTFNNKQAALNGTGFVKISGTTISYDNSTYLTTAAAASTYVPYTGATSGVDIGTYTLSASNLIANGGFNAGALLLKQSSNAQTIFLGYTAITPVGNNTLNFGFSTGSGVWKNFTLSSFLLTDNINRTYTLPDASGTIALVGGSGVGTVTSVAALTLGTSGTDLSSTVANGTTTPVITLNVPTASAANRGALSAADWTTFNGKQDNIVAGTTAQYYRGDKTFQTLNTAAVPELTNLYYTEARVSANTDVAANTAARHNAVTLGTANGLSLSTQQLSLGLASSSANGALSSTDWTTFNNKQNALTNPVTGTGTTNFLPKFTGTSTIGNSTIQTDGSGNLMVGSANAGNAGTINVSVGVAGTTAGGLQLWAATNQTHFIQFGDGTTGAQVYAGYLAYAHSTDSLLFGTNGADKMTLTSSGNLGLGVTPSAWSLGKAIQVNNASFWGYLNNAHVLANAYFDSGFKYVANGVAALYEQNNAAHIWYNAPSGTAGNAISFTQAMTLFASGNLAVGPTTDAGFKLDVNGTGRFTGQVDSLTRFYVVATPPATNGGLINVRDTVTATNVTSFGGVFFNSSPGSDYSIGKLTENGTGFLQIRNANSGAELLRINSTGAATFSSSVTAPSFISDGGGSEGVMRIERDTVGTNAIIGALNFTNNNGATIYGRVRGGRNSAGDGYVSLGTGVGDNLYALEGGNVGIGTASPSVAAGLGLVLNGGSGQTRLAFKNTYTGDASGDGVQFALIGGSSAFVFQNRESDGYFSFETNGNEVFRTSGTNLLVGTTTDAGFKLDVNGTGRFSGSITSLINIAGIQNQLILENVNTAEGLDGNSIYFKGYQGSLAKISAYGIPTQQVGGYLQLQSYSDNTTANIGLIIHQGGNVLIGTTSDNSNKLRVNGSIWADGNILMDSSVNRFVGFGTGNSNAHISFLSTNTLSLNSSSGGLIQFNINGNQIGRFNSVEVFANSVLTSAPYGTTARSWKLGRYITETTSADGSIRVEIDGRYYNIAAQDLGVVPS